MPEIQEPAQKKNRKMNTEAASLKAPKEISSAKRVMLPL